MMAERKKVILTKRRINEMYGACVNLLQGNDPLSQKFSYALAFNMDAIEVHVKAFDRYARGDREYIKYEDERVELAKLHSRKDGDGNPVMRRGNYDIIDTYTFEKELDVLREKHPAYEKRENALDETVEVELHMVQERYAPEFISFSLMRSFFCFIEKDSYEFECPACGAELYMEDNQLKEFEEPDEPEEKPEPKRVKVRKECRQETGT